MFVEQCQPKINLNPLVIGIMNENNALKLEILNHLIYLSTRFRSVFISQGTLAAKYGVTRQWINNLLSRWKSEGVIKYSQQGFNRSCIYYLHPLLAQEKNRIRFKLPAAVLLLAISSLCSAVSWGELTLSNNKNYLSKNQSINQSIIQSIYLKNQSIPSEHPQSEDIVRRDSFEVIASMWMSIGKKGKEMNEVRPIINQIKDQFRIPDDQMSFFEKHSDIVLKDAILKYDAAANDKDIKHPIGYFRRVVGTAQEKHERKAETGRTKSHSSKASNPAGHSPSAEASNLSTVERMMFAANQVSSLNSIKESTPIMESLGMHLGYVDRAKSNWKRICQNPKEFPGSVEVFKQNYAEASVYTEGVEYEEQLEWAARNAVDKDAYKAVVRIADYRKIMRK